MFGGFGGSFGGSGVKKYATVADLPFSGVQDGTLAHVEQNLQGESALYLRTSGGWYKVATVNLAPSILVGPDASYTLPNDGSGLVIELSAEDPEGLPIEWSFSPSTDLSGIASVDGAGQIFVVSADPAAISAQTGQTFSLTFTVTDGVSVAGATSEFTLAFSVGPANPAALLLDATYSTATLLGAQFSSVVMGPPGILFGIATAVAEVAGVYALDVSDPQNISLISYYKPPAQVNISSASTATYARGHLAYEFGSGAIVLDVSDPANMTQKIFRSSVTGVIGFAGDLLVCTGPKVQTVALTGESGSVVSQLTTDAVAAFIHPSDYEGPYFAWAPTGTTLRSAYISSVSETGVLANVRTLPYDSNFFNIPKNCGFFDGNVLLYTAPSSGQDVRSFDTSGLPAAPVAGVRLPVVADPSLTNTTYTTVTYSDGYAYAIHFSPGAIRVFDVRDVQNPQNLGLVPADVLPRQRSMINERLAAFGGGRMLVLDGLRDLTVLK